MTERRREDEPPMTEEEEAYGRAYWEHLSTGDLEPDDSHLDAWRAAVIRGELRGRWGQLVKRITRSRT